MRGWPPPVSHPARGRAQEAILQHKIIQNITIMHITGLQNLLRLNVEPVTQLKKCCKPSIAS